MTTLPASERFWRKVTKTDSCWLWNGYCHPKQGHGRFYLQHNPNVIVAAHRYSYELYFGPLTANDYVDQTCGEITCVNPAHLQLRQRNPGEEVRFWSKVQKLSEAAGGCWLWIAATDKNGYGLFRLDNHGNQVRATHYSWKLHTARSVPDSMVVMHSCDHPPCVNPSHLSLGTIQDNKDDEIRKSRHHHGEAHKRAKLTEANVREIRNSPLSNVALAKKFGVCHSGIARIKHRTSWKHVAD